MPATKDIWVRNKKKHSRSLSDMSEKGSLEQHVFSCKHELSPRLDTGPRSLKAPQELGPGQNSRTTGFASPEERSVAEVRP